MWNTNVIELYSRLAASTKQLNYYNSGVGTITKPKSAWKWITQKVDSSIDLAIAWNFERVVIAAYRWLSERFKPGDRIYLFGFSRGAYQVGLIQEGNEEQIPFAFELYKTPGNNDIASRFKETFSMKGAEVHFLGVWDTVSSVGLVGNKILPLTDEWKHVKIFRHALALDERRVKFIPECIMRKDTTTNFEEEVCYLESGLRVQRVKEVWFAGSHSDVGGGNLPNDGLNLESVPLLWMVNEAAIAGLLLTQSSVEWKIRDLETSKPFRSLQTFWWPLEILPLHRQSRSDPKKGAHWHPHFGKSRAIYPGQKIHASVAFKNTRYRPEAEFYPTPGARKKFPKLPVEYPDWHRLVGEGPDGAFRNAEDWIPRLEMDLFDLKAAPRIFTLLSGSLSVDNTLHVLNRLGFLVSLDYVRGVSGIWPYDTPATHEHTTHDYTNLKQKRRDLLGSLLCREDRVFLGSVKFLVRLATSHKEEADNQDVTNILVQYQWPPEIIAKPTAAPQINTVSQDSPPLGGVVGRVAMLLMAGGSVGRESANTILDIAPISEVPLTPIRQQLIDLTVNLWETSAIERVTNTLINMLSGADADAAAGALVAMSQYGIEQIVVCLRRCHLIFLNKIDNLRARLAAAEVTNRLVEMLSEANATAAASVLVALSQHDSTWQTIFRSMHEPEVLNLNSRLQPPDDDEADDTRDAAAMIIAELADHLLIPQSAEKADLPSGMSNDQAQRFVDGETISLLSDMLEVDTISSSAANALGELSKHAEIRKLILKKAVPDLIGMLRKPDCGPALNAVAKIITTQKAPKDKYDVRNLILRYGKNTSFKHVIGVTSKTESLIHAIANTLKDSARGSAAIILKELLSEPIIILDSLAPRALMESLNYPYTQDPVNGIESAEYGALMTCLAAIIETHAKLRLKAKKADNPPPSLSLVLKPKGAELLFRMVLKTSPECRAAADVLVALAKHRHPHDTSTVNRNVIDTPTMNRWVDFTKHLEDMRKRINGETPESLTLASNVASMTMTLAVLGHAEAQLLFDTLETLHKLWVEALKKRAKEDQESASARAEGKSQQQALAREDGRYQGQSPAQDEETDKQDRQLLRPDSYGEQADIVADAIAEALNRNIGCSGPKIRKGIDDSKGGAENLVARLVERLGAKSQRGTWRAIKELASAKIGQPARFDPDDSCRKAVCSNRNLIPTLVWLSREGNDRQAVFANKCLADLEDWEIEPRHTHSGGKFRKLCKKMLVQ
ncbi:hypothetical protein HWV62_39345 [Athelia sp. TMB]|nr:hypothetical protein HWV62_39345 [Athelia sp. TMB]